MLGLSLATVYLRDPPQSSSAQVPHSMASDLFSGTDHGAASDAPMPVDLHKFALNAFLVPLLDDAVPPRWTDAAVEFTCDLGTSIWVDGQPMVPGNPIPAHDFVVSWAMDKCSPFGRNSVELTGGVVLMVPHTAAGFSAVVKPDQLKVDSPMGRAWLRGPFAADLQHLVALHAEH